MTKDSASQQGERVVQVTAGPVTLEGNLVIPKDASGIVVFAHGSGSSRHSPRNRYVAQMLHKVGLATLLIDLLTLQEEEIDLVTREYRFDIVMLAERLVGATQWLKLHPPTRDLRIGYFGASTGAGAALIAAAQNPENVHAVVSRGGRPDLAGEDLKRVKAPTLLIVGGFDYPVIKLNEEALEQISAVKKLLIIPGASHLFEESGTLEAAAHHAADWFFLYLVKAPTRTTL